MRDSGFSSLVGSENLPGTLTGALDQGQGRLSEVKDGVTALLAEGSADAKPWTHGRAKPVRETERFQEDSTSKCRGMCTCRKGGSEAVWAWPTRSVPKRPRAITCPTAVPGLSHGREHQVQPPRCRPIHWQMLWAPPSRWIQNQTTFATSAAAPLVPATLGTHLCFW